MLLDTTVPSKLHTVAQGVLAITTMITQRQDAFNVSTSTSALVLLKPGITVQKSLKRLFIKELYGIRFLLPS